MNPRIKDREIITPDDQEDIDARNAARIEFEEGKADWLMDQAKDKQIEETN